MGLLNMVALKILQNSETMLILQILDARVFEPWGTTAHKGFRDHLGKDDEDSKDPYWRFSSCWMPLFT